MYVSIQRIHLVNLELVKIWHILHLDIILAPLGTSDATINTLLLYISPPCIFILKLLCVVNIFFCYRHSMGLCVHPLFKKLLFPTYPSLSFLWDFLKVSFLLCTKIQKFKTKTINQCKTEEYLFLTQKNAEIIFLFIVISLLLIGNFLKNLCTWAIKVFSECRNPAMPPDKDILLCQKTEVKLIKSLLTVMNFLSSLWYVVEVTSIDTSPVSPDNKGKIHCSYFPFNLSVINIFVNPNVNSFTYIRYS